MHRRQRGSVVLVALSCVTVLGIALASFLALSNQAMKLSNRTYAQAVSRQLAQMGLERALRSYNANTFSSWSLSGVTATRTLSIASSRYGNSGITASVNIRVDHYLDTKKATPWSMSLTYAVGDFVWYMGVWYLCIAAPPGNEAPYNNTYWKSAPESWTPSANYQINNIVLSGGTAYRCTTGNIGQVPPNTTYWTALTAGNWSSATTYAVDNIVYTGGMAYRCLVAHTAHAPPNTTYWVSAPVIYAEGVATLPDSNSTTLRTQLRATLAPASLFPNAVASASYTNLSSAGVVDSYNSFLGSYNQTSAPFTAANPNIGSSAVVAGGKTNGTAVAITNVRVNGYVAAPASSAPYVPLYTNSTSGMVTAASVSTSPTPSPKIDLTRLSRSPYIPQFDIQSVSPTTINALSLSSPLPGSGTLQLPRGSDNVNAADGKYYYYTSGDIDLNSGDILVINKPVVIDVRPSASADFYIRGTGKINITSNATYPIASLEVHFGGRLYIGSDSGGGIDNQTADPKRCIILGTSSYNSSGYHYFWSNVYFHGVIYMPNAYLHMWNSGYNEQLHGALSASNVYFNHATNLHYDTSLRTAVISGVDSPYEIAELRELTDPAEKVTLP
ncbi:MAG: hypothetical protein NTV51_07475 [Verrucomicrobia bacterium]|nr:hypothetical protein [Verrucomicrobiota bacterium]